MRRVVRRLMTVRPGVAVSPPPPPPPAGLIDDNPRLLLTPTRLATLTARREANTLEYGSTKSFVDTYLPATADRVCLLTSSTGTASSGTFTVDSVPAGWATASHQIMIGLELLTVTRSGTTFTIVSRGNVPSAPGLGGSTQIANHASGTPVFEGAPAGNYINLAPAAAELVRVGAAGYGTKARHALAACALVYGSGSVYTDDNQVRWIGWFLALAYDWLRDDLTAAERGYYAELLRVSAVDHLTNAKEVAGNFVRQSQFEQMVGGNNIANSQAQFAYAVGAATLGDQASAEDQWEAAKLKIDNYIEPALNGGAVHGGLPVEGTEYGQTDWVHWLDIFAAYASSVGDPTILSDMAPFCARLVKTILHLTVPGSSNAAGTTGTISSGTTALTLASGTGFVKGENIVIAGLFHTAIVDISGTSATVRDPADQTYTTASVQHRQQFISIGDVENSNNFRDFDVTGGEPQIALAAAQRVLVAAGDTTSAGYIEHWLSTVAPTRPSYLDWKWFLERDTGITPVDYTASLAPYHAVDDPDAMSFVSVRNTWAASGFWAGILSGHEPLDHSQHFYGDFWIRRSGVYLTRWLSGYFQLTGLSPPYPFYNYPTADDYWESPWSGAPFHNVPWMNGHGSASPFIDLGGASALAGPASMPRSFASATYSYARVDGSNAYSSAGWTTLGYANNNAQTYVRDWLCVPGAEVVVVHDRYGYSAATTSPTRWHGITPGNPSLAGQRQTMTYGGQKLVRDVVLPTSASITITSMATENAALQGYRTAVESGVSAATEYFLIVDQAMASAGSPATVTTLTTTNANVVQVGSIVYGFVRGATPTLNVTYTHSSATAHYLAGFVPDTAYHVTDSGGTVTVAAATGTGDTTANGAGVLAF